ncbi:MAG TPA: serine acetyltransferase [Solirubrobacteraceae bacterium]|nr:serine acetyltransferase [Solirubrobacteraceae bacterium]
MPIIGEVLSLMRADLVRWCSPGGAHQTTTWRTRTVARALICELGTWAVVEYRLRCAIRTAPAPFDKPAMVVAGVSRKVIEVVTGISISSGAVIGPGLYIGHFSGIVVGRGVRIGENCNLSHGVTVGGHHGCPVIGDAVYLAAGAKVFGPISIGDHVAIGANVVVRQSVPSFSTVVVAEPTVLENRRYVKPPEG